MSIVSAKLKLPFLKKEKSGDEEIKKDNVKPNWRSSGKIKRLRDRRVSEIRKQKNFLPALIISVILWVVLILIIVLASPNSKGMLEIFFVFLFLSLLFTSSLIFGNTRRGFMTALASTVFVILRYFGIGNLANLVLIVGAAVAFEIYFTKAR